jgi:hypothetical protein
MNEEQFNSIAEKQFDGLIQKITSYEDAEMSELQKCKNFSLALKTYTVELDDLIKVYEAEGGK